MNFVIKIVIKIKSNCENIIVCTYVVTNLKVGNKFIIL